MSISTQRLEKQVSEGLGQAVTRLLEDYFASHQGVLPPAGLYDRIIREVEYPLLQVVLKSVGGNQKKAAELLGMNRNTLRKKLNEHDIHVART